MESATIIPLDISGSSREGLAMQRINTWAFYSLGYDIHPLSALGWKSTLSESFLMILSGRSSLLTLLGDEIMDLPLSKEAGRNL